MKRDFSIDYLKFALVVFVILGHSIQFYLAKVEYDFDESIIFRFIYSFHMPLFIFLSGCLFSLSKRLDIFKLFSLLIIPFFAWSIINFYFSGSDLSLIKYLYKVVFSPDSGLWFLWVLFWLMLTTHIVLKVSKGVNWVFLFISTLYAVILYLVHLIFNFSAFGVKLYTWYWIFFIAGVYFYKNKNYLYFKRNWTNALLIIMYAFFFTLWKRDLNTYEFVLNPIVNTAIGLAINYMCAFLVLVFVALNWDSVELISLPKFISFCSINSLAFYAIQFPVIEILLRYYLPTNSYIGILYVFVATFGISYFSIAMINKFSPLRKLLFGR
jgi:fucose 4-O-acetylase-like acetyltransferase